MGKRARKTRWRTLSIQDEQSDSEESTSTHRYGAKKQFLTKSVPRRRYQYDSTRSNSTTSDTKITFNEDEYTRITTPRQDVLFKKGYLSKPKTYQTQTSTGNSTTTSTGNGTPDCQSTTDLEYDSSQFVFPNGFVDQNGIYYVNSFEPYPVMVYNPPTYYADNCPGWKTKRYSTGSLSESLSPNNEENSSQDLSQSGGETAPNPNFPDFPVYNMVYPYYVNGVCPQPELESADAARRTIKRRRRKTSKTLLTTTTTATEASTSEYSDQETDTDTSKPPSNTSSTCTSPHSEMSTTANDGEPIATAMDTKLKADAKEFIPLAHRQAAVNRAVDERAFNQKLEPQQQEEETQTTEPTTTEPTAAVDVIKEATAESNTTSCDNVRMQPKKPYTVYNRRYSNTYTRSEAAPAKKQWTPRSPSYRFAPNREATKEVKKINTTPVKVQKPNQWISVSSKKKRKNKNVEELEDEAEDIAKDEEFECYDVNQLVDVVPPSVLAAEAAPVEEIVVPTIEAPKEETPKSQDEAEQQQEEKKKKSKKGTQKPLTKRVIIRDVQLYEPSIEITEVVEAVPEQKPVAQAQAAASGEAGTSKKQRKKKKKAKPAMQEEPQSHGNETIKDSYDFLLDGAQMDEAMDKTNIEVYQELDKIIQKGMYSNLEHKMRSLDIADKEDDFFQTVMDQPLQPLPADKANFAAAPDFTKILQSTRKLCTNSPVSAIDAQLISDEPLLLSSSTYVGSNLLPADGLLPVAPDGPVLDFVQQQTTTTNTAIITDYPITEAVRLWMRETTPSAGEDNYWEEDLFAVDLKARDDQDEDEVLVYESNFGSNEDYNSIRAEVHATKQKDNDKGFPYRASCCELM